MTTATRNVCKLCAPLGAAVVFRGIEGAMPFFHGSQGCATYIRRYLISHFREPVDIASSSFSEETAIFGGRDNLKDGLMNVCAQYNPQLIGVATTCLSEVIGDDVTLFLKEFASGGLLPEGVKVINVSTPSFKGTHMDGFYAAIRAAVSRLCLSGSANNAKINIFPSFLSCADLRHLKEILSDFGFDFIMLPDYSETLDGPSWDEYQRIPKGGTPVKDIESMGDSRASIEFSYGLSGDKSPASLLFERFGVLNFNPALPLGIKQTDDFFVLLKGLSGLPMPEKYVSERGRLIDSYADGHKYVFGKKAAVYGEEELVIPLTLFLCEIGVKPVLCVTPKEGNLIRQALENFMGNDVKKITVKEEADFMYMEQELKRLKPDFLIGNSKGYSTSRKSGIPLIRVAFPIHDRFGAQRLQHIGYRGTQRIFDEIVNTLLREKQDKSKTGYTYL